MLRTAIEILLGYVAEERKVLEGSAMGAVGEAGPGASHQYTSRGH